MDSLLADTLFAIENPLQEDPILECYNYEKAVLCSSLKENPESVLALADSKLRVFPFKNVKLCWRRLYTDASILLAIRLMKTSMQSQIDDTRSDGDSSWLESVVRYLDMALIMTGAPWREKTVESLFSALKEWQKNMMHSHANQTSENPATGGAAAAADDDGRRSAKRRKLTTPLFFPGSSPVPELTREIPRVSAPSFHTMENHIQNVRTPLVITDTVDHWPAMSDRPWSSKDYWYEQTLQGRRLVPVEVGRSYTDEEWGQRIIPFSQFVDTFLWRTDDGRRTASGETKEDEQNQTGYLAQHDLLTQIPALRRDVSVPDFCYIEPPEAEAGTPVYLKKLRDKEMAQSKSDAVEMSDETEIGLADEKREKLQSNQSIGKDHAGGYHSDDEAELGVTSDPIINTWIGPAWTISPLHHDAYHNILVQVVGAKYIRLYSPHTPASQIYPRGMEAVNSTAETSGPDDMSKRGVGSGTANTNAQLIDMSNTSQVDLAAIEMSPAESELWESTWPGFAEADYVETVLKEGECLYIPIGWWHYVRGLRAGISVSFWWA